MAYNRICHFYLDPDTFERLVRVKGGRRKGRRTPINVSAICRDAISQALDAIEPLTPLRRVLQDLEGVLLTDGGDAVQTADELLTSLSGDVLDGPCRVSDERVTFYADDGVLRALTPW